MTAPALPTIACNRCRHTGCVSTYKTPLSVYHDLKCPRCGSTDVNTAPLNALGDYDYGDNNTLNPRRLGS